MWLTQTCIPTTSTISLAKIFQHSHFKSLRKCQSNCAHVVFLFPKYNQYFVELNKRTFNIVPYFCLMKLFFLNYNQKKKLLSLKKRVLDDFFKFKEIVCSFVKRKSVLIKEYFNGKRKRTEQLKLCASIV
jgi:hypothetical protein